MTMTQLGRITLLAAISILVFLVPSGIGQLSVAKTVPNLVNLSEEDAIRTLENANIFSYNINEGHNNSVRFGFIYDQKPKYPEILPLGDVVEVYENIPLIKIYTPIENESVNHTVLIRGHISPNLRENDYLWIGAKPLNDISNWWPQSNGIIRPVRGEFEANTFLGGISNDRFEIGIFIINQSLNEKFNKWLNFTTEHNVWPPITKVNPGAMVPKEVLEAHKYANITVILK